MAGPTPPGETAEFGDRDPFGGGHPTLAYGRTRAGHSDGGPEGVRVWQNVFGDDLGSAGSVEQGKSDEIRGAFKPSRDRKERPECRGPRRNAWAQFKPAGVAGIGFRRSGPGRRYLLPIPPGERQLMDCTPWR